MPKEGITLREKDCAQWYLDAERVSALPWRMSVMSGGNSPIMGRTRIMELKVIIKKGVTGLYVARCPALKGCWSQGRTEEEALANIQEAIEGWLEVEQEKTDKLVRGKSAVYRVQV
jgi:predicted RNase H-like HicB family nuclease